MWWTPAKYEPVRSSIESGELDETKLYDGSTTAGLKSPKSVVRKIVPWVARSLLLCTSGALLFMSWQKQPICQCSAAPKAQELAEAVAAVGSRQPRTFDGNFFSPSKYRGYPTPEMDAAWDNITLVGSLALSRDDMVRIGKLVPSSVGLPEEPSESYQGSLEVFHQIHCVDLIRRMTYPDYYQKEEWFHTPVIRSHADHCIEMLRQKLMCEADLHVFTYNWVDRAEHPWPDFSTTEMCRNFDDVLEWGITHQAYTEAPHGYMDKAKDSPVLHIPTNKELGLEVDN